METETAVEAIAEETVETAGRHPEVTEVAHAAPSRSSSTARIQTVGRRKEAVVRVRLVPRHRPVQPRRPHAGELLPRTKVHQQLIKAPLVTVDQVDSFDIYAHLDGGGPSRRPARFAWPSPVR